MKSKYNFEVDVTNPKIPYRETIRSKVDNIEYKHKNSRAAGDSLVINITIKIEPVEQGKGFEFVNAIVGGVIPGRFIPAVEKVF